MKIISKLTWYSTVDSPREGERVFVVMQILKGVPGVSVDYHEWHEAVYDHGLFVVESHRAGGVVVAWARVYLHIPGSSSGSGSNDKESESVMQDTTEHDHRDDPTTPTTPTTYTPVITCPVLNDADLYAARLTAHEIRVDNRTYRWSYIPKYGITVVMLSRHPRSAYFTLPADFTSIYLLTAAIRAYDAGWRAGHSHGVDYGKEEIGHELRKLIGVAQ